MGGPAWGPLVLMPQPCSPRPAEGATRQHRFMTSDWTFGETHILAIRGYRVRAEPKSVRTVQSWTEGPPCAVDLVDEEVATPRANRPRL